MKKLSLKRLLPVILMAVSALILTACGGNTTEVSQGDPEAAAEYVGEDYVDPVTQWDQYDELVDQIRNEPDTSVRLSLIHQAEEMLVNTYNIIPVSDNNIIYLLNDNIKNLTTMPTGTFDATRCYTVDGSDSVVLNIKGEPLTLDPALTNGPGYDITYYLFSGLYRYSDENTIDLDCAASFPETSDGYHYTIKLKEGLKWSDGSPLTAEDFAYSWKRAARVSTGADLQFLFNCFKGYSDTEDSDIEVEAVDDTTLTFTLKQLCPYIDELMTKPNFLPVKKDVVESAENYQQNPGAWCTEAGFVSNGPFTITQWKHDVSITLDKNPVYVNADEISLNKIVIALSTDATSMYSAYCAGDIDFMSNIPGDELGFLVENGEITRVSYLSITYIEFNAKAPLFDDKTPAQCRCIREAISLLIDRKYICDKITYGNSFPSSYIIPGGTSDGCGGIYREKGDDGYFDATGINTDHDRVVQKAIRLLEYAGYKFEDGRLSEETPLVMDYITIEDARSNAIAESMQMDLYEIGIELQITSYDDSMFYREIGNGNFTLSSGNWILDYNDPLNILEVFTSDSPNNDAQLGQ